jgi:hypothetical protein
VWWVRELAHAPLRHRMACKGIGLKSYIKAYSVTNLRVVPIERASYAGASFACRHCRQLGKDSQRLQDRSEPATGTINTA